MTKHPKKWSDDDKTEAGNSLLKLTYDKKVSDVQDLKGKENTIVSRLNDIESENSTLENRLSTLKSRVKEFENVNKALVNFSEVILIVLSLIAIGIWFERTFCSNAYIICLFF